MKKHTWINYGNFGETIEIIIRNASGGKIESWKFNSSDKNAKVKVFSIIKRKYGINLFLKKEYKDKDLSWLK